MKKISQADLVDILKRINCAQPVNILTATEPQMLKTGNPFYGRIKKLMNNTVFIGVNYQNSVNKVRGKEGSIPDFVAFPRKWGTRIPHTPLVEHKGNLYLECRFLSLVGTPKYMVDGTSFIDESALSNWLVKKKSNAGHQGVSNGGEVILRDYSISSILEIHVDKQRYVIV